MEDDTKSQLPVNPLVPLYFLDIFKACGCTKSNRKKKRTNISTDLSYSGQKDGDGMPLFDKGSLGALYLMQQALAEMPMLLVGHLALAQHPIIPEAWHDPIMKLCKDMFRDLKAMVWLISDSNRCSRSRS